MLICLLERLTAATVFPASSGGLPSKRTALIVLLTTVIYLFRTSEDCLQQMTGDETFMTLRNSIMKSNDCPPQKLVTNGPKSLLCRNHRSLSKCINVLLEKRERYSNPILRLQIFFHENFAYSVKG